LNALPLFGAIFPLKAAIYRAGHFLSTLNAVAGRMFNVEIGLIFAILLELVDGVDLNCYMGRNPKVSFNLDFWLFKAANFRGIKHTYLTFATGTNFLNRRNV
jgi:hypothetical protein